MNRFLSFKRLSILFVAVFAVMAGGTLLAQHFWIAPEQKCEKSGQWWYAEEGRCVTPIYIPNITKRAPGVTRAQASDEQNRELLVIEDRLEVEKAAREAAVVRDREALRAKMGQ